MSTNRRRSGDCSHWGETSSVETTRNVDYVSKLRTYWQGRRCSYECADITCPPPYASPSVAQGLEHPTYLSQVHTHTSNIQLTSKQEGINVLPP